MPTISFPLAYLQRLSNLSPQQLEQQAFSYGLEATLLADVLEVEVTAERPDLLAAEGFTRAMNIYNGSRRSVPENLEDSGLVVQVSPQVQSIRPFIAALVVEQVELGEMGLATLIQFQEKVTQTFGRQRQKLAIGIYDLEQVKGNLEYTVEHQDVLSFVPLGSQQPFTARQILTQHPTGRLYAHTLPTGDWVPVLRDSTGQILSMPPIINAAGIGHVTPTVHRLLIDVTGTVAKAVLEMINILAHNFLDMGAQVKTVTIAAEEPIITPNLMPKAVTYSAKFLNETVGTAIPKHDLEHYLARMDLHPTGGNQILVPSYRTDVFSQIDVAGDLMVAVGLDHLKADATVIQFYSGIPNPLKEFTHRVGDWAQRMGLMEVKSFILTDPDLLAWFSGNAIQTENAKSRSYSTARVTLQVGLLEILSHNINAPKPLNLYEIGEVLHLTSAGSVAENVYWSFASLDSKASFATAKSYIQTMLKALGIQYQLAECSEPRYIPGRAATVLIQGHQAGHFGEINPDILNQFSFPEPICSGELDCGWLSTISSTANATSRQ